MTGVDVPRKRREKYSKHGAHRAAIIEAAAEVFAARGYHAGSFQQIADRVGMSQSSLFHYFPTKRDLPLAVLERRDAVGAMRPDRVHASSFVDEVLAVARANTEIPGVIELYATLSGEAVTEGHPARDYFTRRFAGLRADFAADFRILRELGLLRDGVDPDRAATSLVGLWDGLQLQSLLDPRVDVVGCLRDYLDGILLPDPEPA